MKQWPVQDAKARFSALLGSCLVDGPQMVTKRGIEAAVLVPAEEWRRITTAPPKTLKDWLLAGEPRCDLDIPPRGALTRRPPADLD